MNITSFTWTVVEGTHIASQLGFHTANIGLKRWVVQDGVYKINVVLEEKKYSGIWVFFDTREIFESHIFDFDGNIYGCELEVIVFQKIRDNKGFEHSKDLIAQIQSDIVQVKSMDNKVLTFGTFDVFHKGHESYLRDAFKYGDSLHTIIARDATVEKIKWFIPRDSEVLRLENVQKFGICASVRLWDLSDPLIPVKQIVPDIICLGYDQKSFPKHLQDYVDATGVQVLRMESFQPEVYKSSKLK